MLTTIIIVNVEFLNLPDQQPRLFADKQFKERCARAARVFQEACSLCVVLTLKGNSRSLHMCPELAFAPTQLAHGHFTRERCHSSCYWVAEQPISTSVLISFTFTSAHQAFRFLELMHSLHAQACSQCDPQKLLGQSAHCTL